MSIFRKVDGYFLIVILIFSGGIAFAAQINERIRASSDIQHVPMMDIQRAEAETLFSGMCAEIGLGSEKEYAELTPAEFAEFADVADLVVQVCNSKKSVAELTPNDQLSVLTFSKAI